MVDVHDLKQRVIVHLSQYSGAKRFIDGVHRFRLRRARKQLQIEGYRICHDVCKALQAENIKCFALSGTLLGLVRDGHFIEYDDDIDLAVMVDDGFDWGRASKAMKKAGFRLWREFGFDGKVTEQAYKHDHLSIDLFGQFPIDDGCQMFFYTYDMLTDGAALRVKCLEQPNPGRIQPIQFHGHEINIPANAEGYLEANYGPEWRIPDPAYVAGSRWRYLDKTTCFVRYRHSTSSCNKLANDKEVTG